MLNFCSLFSSSEGNSLFIQSENTNILVDCGVSGKKIENALHTINCGVENINAIIVTHEHIDHVRSLGLLSKKYNIPVYANEETWSAMPKQENRILTENRKLYCPYKEFEIGDLKILPFQIPHDAINPCGFNVFSGKSKLSIATDLGHISPKTFKLLQHSDFIMLESNYDTEVLKYCSYPYSLKRRIDGPNGHLSNNNAGQVISKLIDTGLKTAMLGHLSKESNFPDLAYRTILEELQLNNYNENSINLYVAGRIAPSELIRIS